MKLFQLPILAILITISLTSCSESKGYGFLALAFGLWLMIFSYRKTQKLKEYEFNNRTSGGVVEFKDYKSSKRHEDDKRASKILGLFGFVIFGIGMGVMIMAR